MTHSKKLAILIALLLGILVTLSCQASIGIPTVPSPGAISSSLTDGTSSSDPDGTSSNSTDGASSSIVEASSSSTDGTTGASEE